MTDFKPTPLSESRDMRAFVNSLLYTEPGVEPSAHSHERFTQDYCLLDELSRLLERHVLGRKYEALRAAGLTDTRDIDFSRVEGPTVGELPEGEINAAVRRLEQLYYGSRWPLEPGANIVARLDEHFAPLQARFARSRALVAA